jgi:hypothetical protein
MIEKIQVKNFYIFKDGGYKLTGRWYKHRIEFESHPGDVPELLIDGHGQWPVRSNQSWIWGDLVNLFPTKTWKGENIDYQSFQIFSTIQRTADLIMTAINDIEATPLG